MHVNRLYRYGFMIAPEVATEAIRFAAALLDARIGYKLELDSPIKHGAAWIARMAPP
jgi:hypothetical protein